LTECETQVQHLAQQLSDVTWRARAAEDAVKAEVALKAKLQQELAATKGTHATQALKLLDIQSSQQQLEERISRAEQALVLEQAAKAEACKQVTNCSCNCRVLVFT
jgi:predicted  nucleic acid-binding Zn-ribbon protein